VEITLMASSFGMMVLLYLLFIKFVPIISMWELKAGIRQMPPERHRPASDLASVPTTSVPMDDESLASDILL
jgi:hypothetical protein